MLTFWSLNCGRIEIEAKIFAWFGIFLNALIFIFATYWTVFLINNPCDTVVKIAPIIQITRMYTDSNNCHTISIAALMTAIKTSSVALIELFLLVLLLVGIKKRNPTFIHGVFLYYILMTITGFLWELSSFTSKGYILVIISGVLHSYFIYILYALYSKINSEYHEIETVQMQRI